MSTLTHTSALRSSVDSAGLQGPVILAGEGGWDAARQAWNLAVDQQPAMVAFPETRADLVRLVRLAEEFDLSIVTQGTGHGAASFSSLEGSMLIRTTRMRDLSIEGRRCRVEPGVLWGDVAVEADSRGLAGLAGSSPDVGVVGYMLGGGIGWLVRPHGLACNSVRAVEIVTADGSIRRADLDHEPELFWALRGGGGGLGVVAALEFDLVPLASAYGGTLAWGAVHARPLLRAWAEWTQHLPETTTSIIRYLNLPPLPEVAEPFRGRRMVTLGVVDVGDPAQAETALEQIRRVARPVLDAVGPMPPRDLCRLHGDPEGPSAGMAHHTLLGSLGVEAVDRLDDVAGAESGSPLISVEIRHLGGAASRTPDDAGALDRIDAPYALNAVGVAATAEQAAVSHDALGGTVDAMRRWSGGAYLNFAERPDSDVFPPETAYRLATVKARFDPVARFRSRG